MTDTPKKEEFRVPVQLFDLGQIVATQGALAACSRSNVLRCMFAATGAVLTPRTARRISTRCFQADASCRPIPSIRPSPARALARIPSGSSPRATAARPPSCCRMSINPLPRPRQSRRDRVFFITINKQRITTMKTYQFTAFHDERYAAKGDVQADNPEEAKAKILERYHEGDLIFCEYVDGEEPDHFTLTDEAGEEYDLWDEMPPECRTSIVTGNP